MATEIFKIDASWAEKLKKTRVPSLMNPTVFGEGALINSAFSLKKILLKHFHKQCLLRYVPSTNIVKSIVSLAPLLATSLHFAGLITQLETPIHVPGRPSIRLV